MNVKNIFIYISHPYQSMKACDSLALAYQYDAKGNIIGIDYSNQKNNQNSNQKSSYTYDLFNLLNKAQIDDLQKKFLDPLDKIGVVNVGKFKILKHQVNKASVEFVVPKDVATAGQIEQIQRAIEYGASRGIDIRIIEIP